MTELELVEQNATLKQAAEFVLEVIDNQEFWQQAKDLLTSNPNQQPYYLINQQAYAEAMNFLYYAIHQGEQGSGA